jgi:hypothetical protein
VPISWSGEIGSIPSEFWGANLDFADAAGYANHQLAALVNATPIRFLRLPLVGTNVVGQSVTNWSQVAEFCRWISCSSEMTIGGPGSPGSAMRAGVSDILDQVGLSPEDFVYGNEPNLWNGTSGLAYAEQVQNFTAIVRSLDPSAHVLGAEITGHPGLGDPFIQNVTRLDGANISGFGIQIYPEISGDYSLSGFMAALLSNRSVTAEIGYVRHEISQICPRCQIPLDVDEINGGSSPLTAPFRGGEPDVPFLAASVIQAWRANVSRVLVWTLASLPSYKCEFGLVVLGGSCGSGGNLNPAYYLYSQVFPGFASGTLYNLTAPGDPYLFAVADIGPGGLEVMLVNANATQPVSISLGAAFPQGRCLTSWTLAPSTPGPALTGSFPGPNGTLRPEVVVSLPALSVERIAFSQLPEGCPTPSPAGSGSLLPLLLAGMLVGATLLLTVVALVARRSRRSRSPPRP